MPEQYDLIVIGAGAAGYFAAINAKILAPQMNVCILEGSAKVLSKVAVSGGGRCNVTHDSHSIATLSKAYPRGKSFLKKAFKQFWVPDMIEWFTLRGVELKVEEDGRMFPVSDDSQTIIDCFEKQRIELGITLITKSRIVQIDNLENSFVLKGKSEKYQAKQLLVATGGHSKLEQFSYMSKLNLTIEPPCPSLFTFNLPKQPITELMGLSVANVKVVIPKLGKESFGPLLITHWGMSGPAILVSSSVCAKEMAAMQYEFDFYVDWLPNMTLNEINFSSSKQMGNLNPNEIPKRLWYFFLDKSKIEPSKKGRELSKQEVNKLKEVLKHDVYKAQGKTTFKEEFVTCGGIHLDQIDSKTMEAKNHKGLFFAGEVLNIDAVTGGYNFQAAWTTAFIAAKNIALQHV